MNPPKMNADDKPKRIVIGVTGHRTIVHPELVRSSMKTILSDIESRYALHGPISFVVISPLAEGADRLMARTVLDYSDNSELHTILPMPKADYLKDFETEESKAEFESLLSRSSRLIIPKEKEISESTGEMKRVREETYRSVGHRIVDACDILVALWDGQGARGIGGTAEIIEYAYSKKEKPVYIIDAHDPERITNPEQHPHFRSHRFRVNDP